MEIEGPYSPAPEPAGRRALRNVALGYLASRGRPEDIARAAAHFAQSRNLTDETAALSMLSELNSPERANAFERFYERWKGDHLVIDNWFAYQAASPLASSLATVKKLTRHPLFSIKNPNKVRALIGTFAVANPVNFNRPDGRGLRLRRRPGAGARCLQPADRRAAPLRLPQLEGAGAGAPASCKEDPAAHRQGEAAVARRIRDRLQDARVERPDTASPYFCRKTGFASRQAIGQSVKVAVVIRAVCFAAGSEWAAFF